MIFLLLLAAGTARAESIVLGLSQNQVSITATFDGQDILIFGAVSREAPAPAEEGELGVIVTVEGPDLPVTVYRKARRMGIWVNVDEVEVDTAPAFYAVATSAPLREVLRDVEDLRNSITLPRAIRSVGARVEDSTAFTEALIRIKERQDLYQSRIGAVDLQEETLFRVSFELPANLPEGDYTARIFLTRDGRPIDEASAKIPVQKVGIEQWLYEMSQTQSVFYGLLSLALAIAAGWGASAAFAVFRR
ncbi:TIGR02186 family protein [Salipiger sp. IMCC34102]|uniref:TIGR02186 family protein n=1 Tax=Salipiger sp. IMCC34102 TaxID=2510647 RepID=UPI001F5C6E65|nr:TIGR02186 family protein [Salipiger sp. IMCC34102]